MENLNEIEAKAVMLNNKGENARRLGAYREAESYFKKALEIAKNYKISSMNKTAIFSNYGLLLNALKKHDEAIVYQKKALEIDIQTGVDANIAYSLHNLGVAYLNNQRYDDAIEKFLKAKDLRKALNDHDELLTSYEMLSLTYFAKKQIGKAEKYAKAGLALKNKMSNKSNLRNVISTLADVYASRGKWNDASKTQLKAINLLEHLRFNLNGIQALDKFDARYNNHYRKGIEYCIEAGRFEDSLSLIDLSRFRSGCDALVGKRKYCFPCTTEKPKIKDKELFLIEWIYIDHDWSFCLMNDTKEIKAIKIVTSEHKGVPIRLNAEVELEWFEHFHRRIKQTQPVLDNYKNTINNKKKIIFIPHGTQWQTPFATLRNPVSGEFLCKTHEMFIAPSLRYCTIPKNDALERITKNLVIGDPTNDLECAKKEAEFIAKKLKVKPILGSKATKAEVLRQINGCEFNVIHYSGHSELYGKGLPGIRLYDGIITPEEFANSNFAANLLNLSSCWGGIVEDDVWNELRGFIREVLTMNINSIISSTYPCNDEALYKFNTVFYNQYLDELKEPATAFKNAVSSICNKFSVEKWGGLYITGKRKKIRTWQKVLDFIISKYPSRK